MIIKNEDIENYYLIAQEPHTIYDSIGNVAISIFRGQVFRWLYKTIDDDHIDCLSCGNTKETHVISGLLNCPDFKDKEGKRKIYHVPSEKFVESYDAEDVDDTCESWQDEVGGYNKELFTPPNLREEYKNWNSEKQER